MGSADDSFRIRLAGFRHHRAAGQNVLGQVAFPVCQIVPDCCLIEWDSGCVDWVDELCLPPMPVFNHVLSVTTVATEGDDRRLDSILVRGGGGGWPEKTGPAGGAMRIIAGGIQIARCQFEDNISDAGGAIGWLPTVEDPEDPEDTFEFDPVNIFNCVFTGNTREKIGGAILAEDRFLIVNCLFHENQQYEPALSMTPKGGAIADRAPDTAVPRQVVNCTIVENSAQSSGGGIYTGGSSESGSGLEVINSIIRLNVAPTNPQIDGFPSLVLHCNIEDWSLGGTGNIDQNPLFAASDNYRLTPGSPSVDTGVELVGTYATLLADILDVDDDNDFTEPTPDLDLKPRVLAGSVGGCDRVDMGAYELDQACDVGDLNEDCAVDGGDLGELLSQWGTCGSPCVADLNCDGMVDGADLGLLLGEWGPVTFPRSCCPESFQSNAMAFEGGALTFAELLELLGLSSTEEFVEWVTGLPFGEMAAWLDLIAN